MLAAHHYCFEYLASRTQFVRSFMGVVGLGASVTLSGCNASNGWESMTAGLTEKKVETSAPKGIDANAVGSTKKQTAGRRSVKVNATNHGYQSPELSAKCRQILAAAGIETTILRSPTIAAEANDDGNVGGSISYDFVDMQRAKLKDELAVVQCRRHAASTRLAQLLVTSPQSMTRAGHLARANALRGSAGAFAKINREISHSLNDGVLTIQMATALRQHLNTVKSQESYARSEATRRQAVDSVQGQTAAGLDRELLEAESEAHRLQKQLRTADAVSVQVTGGYSVDSNDNNQALREDRGAYAKVKVSLRLGALRQRRHEFEDELLASRTDGLYEPNTGAFWKASEIGRANKRAVSALERQRRQVRVALKQAKRNANLRSSEYDTETRAISIRGKIDRLALQASLAGLNATIADTKRIAQKLRYQ